MNVLSDEQQNILDNIKKGYNVLVDSCAGTGKTTLILSVAKELSDKNILQLTYNSMLRHEVKDRAKDVGLNNIKVHTFHSLGASYYLTSCMSDTDLKYIILNDVKPIREIIPFDIVVLDEAQDMAFCYFQFIAKFIRDAGSKIQLLVLGDYMQGLYEFKGSDIRYLTFADLIWSEFSYLKTDKFVDCAMKMSYRITNQMCSFVNDVMLGENRMEACRGGTPVEYIRSSPEGNIKIVACEINRLLSSGVNPSDIFVLAGSVKGVNSDIRQLENALSERNIPCHIPMLEDKIDERVINGKVVFSTFHSIKGRQRKYVFIVGFDNSYYFGKDFNRNVCPNTLYVAATRATHGLYLLERDSFRNDRPLDFLKKNHVEMKQCDYIRFRGQHQTLFVKDEEDEANSISLKNSQTITPSELIKFIPDSTIDEITPLLDRIFVNETVVIHEIDIPIVIETKNGLIEEVSDLNGVALPCYYYDILKDIYNVDAVSQTNSLFAIIENTMENMKYSKKNREHKFFTDILSSFTNEMTSINDYLYLANVSHAVQETVYFRLKQIKREEHAWLTDTIVEQCIDRLDDIIGPECALDVPIVEETIIDNKDEYIHEFIDKFISNNFNTQSKFRFKARVDLITKNTVWELKCTSKISIDHKLQVVCYAWLWKMRKLSAGDNGAKIDEKNFKIFNIKTNELLRLDASIEDLNTIMLALLKGKYERPPIKIDTEFISDCKNYLDSL